MIKTAPQADEFRRFRENTIGYAHAFDFAGGKKPILYADWAASGRLYRPIEEYISHRLGPFVANTHTETNLTGTVMTSAYHEAHDIIKKHVHAAPDDILLFAGFGMTAVINKFQRIMGLRIPEKYKDRITLCEEEKPLVLVTHMEHHSNQTTWEECCCDVDILCKTSEGIPNLENLREVLEANRHRKRIIGSFTASSNVTGIITPYHEMAEIMHEYGGLCFVDFSASAPYVPIDMHPANPKQKLDAIFFSPHKFLGGPGSSGVILFDKQLYQITVPDHPGGGTVLWTNPWGKHRYFDNIELREDGGTPGFLQAIRASLAILLKEEMGSRRMLEREHHLTNLLMDRLIEIEGIEVLEPQNRNRVGFVSFFCPGIHHNLMVKLLNDRFGIQVRGGCLCAGTYGHLLLNITVEKSEKITERIDHGDMSTKPGWVRISLHPTMLESDVEYICDAVSQIVAHHKEWSQEYRFNSHTGDFEHQQDTDQPISIRKSFRP